MVSTMIKLTREKINMEDKVRSDSAVNEVGEPFNHPDSPTLPFLSKPI